MQHSNRQHSRKGAALVEGVIALCLIIGGTVIAISFLTSYGMILYYKEKIAFVANQIASECAQAPNISDETMNGFAKELFEQMSMPATDLEVKRDLLTVLGRPAVKITIANKKMPLFHRLDILPMSTTVSDEAVAIIAPSPAYCDAYLWAPRAKFRGYVLPLVKIPSGGAPDFGSMPILQF